MLDLRVGTGYDVHRLVPGRPLVLGGIGIPSETGALGHSDADVLLHALMDAMLGALALGDIGQLFPDTDPELKGIDSRLLLKEVHDRVKEANYRILNLDATIVLQRPKIGPYIPEMRQELSRLLELRLDQVSIKATTTEGLGFEGRGEGIAAHAIVLMAATSL